MKKYGPSVCLFVRPFGRCIEYIVLHCLTNNIDIANAIEMETELETKLVTEMKNGKNGKKQIGVVICIPTYLPPYVCNSTVHSYLLT